MSTTVDDLILDLLEWLSHGPRPYADVLEAWRTSCPRLPVWEEANERGYVLRTFSSDRGAVVAMSREGDGFLRRHRPLVDRSR